MARIFLLWGLLAWPQLGWGQLKPQYSQYFINNYLLNPAITGIEDYADLKLSFRQQWAGIAGAPATFYASGHTKLGHQVNVANPAQQTERPHAFGSGGANRYRKVRPHHGLGGLLLHDRAGIFSFTEANLTYAYHLLLTREVKLSLGVAAGLLQYNVRGADLNLANPNDPAAVNLTERRPNLGLGLWLYAPRFYLGASGGQLLGGLGSGSQPLETAIFRHYFITGAYKLPLNRRVYLLPSVLAKWASPLPPRVDANLRAVYNDRLWAGAAFRPGDSWILAAGLALTPLLDLSYSLDLGTHRLGRRSWATHEIVLGLRLGNRFGVYCPQNLY
jgi:type IX secretion system PorP/SprF family membrane protein